MPCPSCSSAYLDQYGRCPACGYGGGFAPPGPYAGPYPGSYAPPAGPSAPTSTSLAAQILIGVSGLIAVVAAAVNIYGYTLSTRVTDINASGDVYQQAHTATGIIGVVTGFTEILNLATGVVFIIWCYKAARLSAVLAPGRQSLPPGMAIGGWFIPLAFLVLPRMTMGGIWRAGEPLRDAPMMRKPGTQLVTYWWITFAVAQLGITVGLPSLSTPDSAIDNNDPTATFVLFVIVLAVLLLRVVSAVLGVIMLRRLTARQQVRILQGPGPGHPYSAAAFGGYGRPQPPYQPEPYVPQAYTPQAYAPQPYAPPHQQQPQGYIPTQPPAPPIPAAPPAEPVAVVAAAEPVAAPQDAVPGAAAEPAVDLGKAVAAEDQP